MLPPVTKLPRVTSARLTFPSMGLVTFVKFKLSAAASRAAVEPATLASACATVLKRSSNSSWDTAPLSFKCCTRVNSMRPKSSAVLKRLTSAAARS